MVNESYDWWSTKMSLPYDEDLLTKLGRYECHYDGCGFRVLRGEQAAMEGQAQ